MFEHRISASNYGEEFFSCYRRSPVNGSFRPPSSLVNDVNETLTEYSLLLQGPPFRDGALHSFALLAVLHHQTRNFAGESIERRFGILSSLNLDCSASDFATKIQTPPLSRGFETIRRRNNCFQRRRLARAHRVYLAAQCSSNRSDCVIGVN